MLKTLFICISLLSLSLSFSLNAAAPKWFKGDIKQAFAKAKKETIKPKEIEKDDDDSDLDDF